jgi:hypothetical protein
MYDGVIQSKSTELRQKELSAIYSELQAANEKTHKLIMEINESLNKILPYNEPNSKAEKDPSKPEHPCLVNSLKSQVKFAYENSERLVTITRHLNTLV